MKFLLETLPRNSYNRPEFHLEQFSLGLPPICDIFLEQVIDVNNLLILRAVINLFGLFKINDTPSCIDKFLISSKRSGSVYKDFTNTSSTSTWFNGIMRDSIVETLSWGLLHGICPITTW